MKTSQISQTAAIKSKFRSTKELYSYAKNKIINYGKKENREYLIIANTKTNEILFEKLGDYNSIDYTGFNFPKKADNITLMHGHPTKQGSPLSNYDCYCLCNENCEKIIAFNNKGRFSLLQRKPNSNLEAAKDFFKYDVYIKESPFLPKNPFKKMLVKTFGNRLKHYEKWIKHFLEKPDINFRYVSTMFK